MCRIMCNTKEKEFVYALRTNFQQHSMGKRKYQA